MVELGMIPHRALICAPIFYEKMLTSYPTRKVECSIWCDNTTVYWIGNKGQVRCYQPEEKRVMVLDHERGFPWLKLRRKLK